MVCSDKPERRDEHERGADRGTAAAGGHESGAAGAHGCIVCRPSGPVRPGGGSGDCPLTDV